MANKVLKWEYGTRIVEGMPGSGKSFAQVREIMLHIADDRRPVLTNLPILWRPMRVWMKKRHGADVAKLLINLDEAHFRAFVTRAARLAKIIEDGRNLRGVSVSPREAMEQMEVELGPNVVIGTPGTPANWIPAGAIIVIDEAHKWYPFEKQANGNLDLKSYLSMQRHMLHRLIFITQDRSNLDINIRKMYADIIQCFAIHERNLFAMVKLKHFGLRAYGWARWNREQMEGTSPDREPLDKGIVWPFLPFSKLVFRLYDSFSQVAKPKDIERVHADTLRMVGLETTKGKKMEPPLIQAAPATPRRLFKKRWLAYPVILLAAYWMGKGQTEKLQPATFAVSEAEKWPAWKGTTTNQVWWDGRLVKPKETYNGLTLLSVEGGNQCLLARNGRIYLWVRDQKPEDLGRADIFAGYLRSAVGAGGAANPGALAPGADSPPAIAGDPGR